MLSKIKEKLLEDPYSLKELLEHFGYCNVTVRRKYIQCGRAENSSKTAIVIKLENNQYLYVTDYARNINEDLFSYIMNQRGIPLIDVLNVVKNKLGLDDYFDFKEQRHGIFGGFYESIKKNRNGCYIKTYDNSILDNYKPYGNIRFLRDNISIKTQMEYNIRYDVKSQGIVIPIYDQIGRVMGIKMRCNWEVNKNESKYFYLIECSMSQTLYGYSHNYKYLQNGTIYIFESEKSVMQCNSYGIYNCVALGSGSISNKQIEMLLEVNPRKIVFLHDTGYKQEYIMRNIQLLKSYSRFSEIKVGYWDFDVDLYDDKLSPSDLGKEELTRILQEEIVMVR